MKNIFRLTSLVGYSNMLVIALVLMKHKAKMGKASSKNYFK